jgi:hypothetical protein
MIQNPSWKKRYEVDFNQLKHNALNPEFSIEKSRDGNDTLKLNNLYVHSKYSPVKESEKQLEKFYKKEHLHIMIGFGLGYLAEQLALKMTEEDRLLIIEPNPFLFEEILHTRDIEQLINNENVEFYIGTDLKEIEKVIGKYMTKYIGRVQIIETPGYVTIYKDFLTSIYQVIKDLTISVQIGINTELFFSNIWQYNYIRNLYNAFQAEKFKPLKSEISCPIIIVASGPSLNKQIPLLKKLKGKALTISAGSTLEVLLKNGYKPDIMVFVDGVSENMVHVNGENVDDIIFMYPPVVFHGLPEYHNGQQVFFETAGFPTCEATKKLLDCEVGTVRGGGSVANFCLDLACQLTSGPVCFVGQDLAYTDFVTHASGNSEQKDIDESTKNNLVQVKGYYGDTVYTSYSLLDFKKSIEGYIEQVADKDREFINATEGGAYIEGTINMKLTDFIETYCQEDISEQIQDLFFKKEEKNKQDWANFYSRIQLEVEKLKVVKKYAQQGLDITRKWKAHIAKPNELRKLDKIDKELSKLLKGTFLHFIFTPLLFRLQHGFRTESVNETLQDQERRIIAKSLTMYEEIGKAVTTTQKYLEELLERVEKHK